MKRKFNVQFDEFVINYSKSKKFPIAEQNNKRIEFTSQKNKKLSILKNFSNNFDKLDKNDENESKIINKKVMFKMPSVSKEKSEPSPNFEELLADEHFKELIAEKEESQNTLPFPLDNILNHKKLNQIQNKCFENLFDTDNSMVISAPTGSGKTGIINILIKFYLK